jgi:tetratricopeptide (TPR) repeat protein
VKKKSQSVRDRILIEIVRGLILSEIEFQDIFKKYKEGHLRFPDMRNWVDDKGQSLLYNLKEQSHYLFRHIGKSSFRKREWLLDLAIGSIFHEAMKLRENIYQLKVYQPKYSQYQSRIGKTTYEKDYLQQFERIIAKAEQGVAEGMEETRSLFRDTVAQLGHFFKENSKNPFLVRFLLENQALLRKVYGSKKTKQLVDSMFPNGYLDAHRIAGQSYLQSEHYDLSSHHFSEAMKINPYDHDIQFLLNFSLGMNAYYTNAYPKTFSHFTKLLALRPDEKQKKDHLRKAEDVCHKISLELKEERGSEEAAAARSIADRIRKML